MINKNKVQRAHTAKSYSRGSNNTGLNDGVLLASERLLQDTKLFKQRCPGLDNGETQQPGGDVEGWYHAGGEVKLANNEVKDDAQEKTRNHCPKSDLLPP